MKILSSDPWTKGNTSVIMNKVEYPNKLVDLIGNSGYCKVKKGPTLKTEKKLSQIFSKNKDLIPQMKYRQLMQHYYKLPQIYGLLKIHGYTIKAYCQQQSFNMSSIKLLHCGDSHSTNR